MNPQAGAARPGSGGGRGSRRGVKRGKPTRSTPQIIACFVLDVALVTLFAFLGRQSHGLLGEPSLGALLGGLVGTVWPFWVGLALSWLVTRCHQAPTSLLRGLGVWIITVAAGLLLRLVTGAGAPLSFVLVTLGVLGVFLVGWRLIAAAFRVLDRAPKSR